MTASRPAVLPPRVDHLEVRPVEVVTDATQVYPRVLGELAPAACHHIERYANNRIGADQSRLKHHCDRCAGYAPTAPLRDHLRAGIRVR